MRNFEKRTVNVQIPFHWKKSMMIDLLRMVIQVLNILLKKRKRIATMPVLSVSYLIRIASLAVYNAR